MQLKHAACLMIPVMASSNFKPAIVQIGKCSLKFAKKMNSWFTVTPGEHSSQNVGSNEQTQARVEVGKCFIKLPKNQPTIHW
jgi:hypothetical protein